MTADEKKTDIFSACRLGDVDRVTEYITKGGCVTESDQFGMTMLHHLAYSGKDALVQTLLGTHPTQNVDVDAADHDGWTPLHFATDQGHDNVVQLLIREGASVCSKDSNKRTPLHLAALGDRFSCAKLLLDNGAPKNAKNVAGMTPLDCAKAVGAKAVLDLFDH